MTPGAASGESILCGFQHPAWANPCGRGRADRIHTGFRSSNEWSETGYTYSGPMRHGFDSRWGRWGEEPAPTSGLEVPPPNAPSLRAALEHIANLPPHFSAFDAANLLLEAKEQARAALAAAQPQPSGALRKALTAEDFYRAWWKDRWITRGMGEDNPPDWDRVSHAEQRAWEAVARAALAATPASGIDAERLTRFLVTITDDEGVDWKYPGSRRELATAIAAEYTRLLATPEGAGE